MKLFSIYLKRILTTVMACAMMAVAVLGLSGCHIEYEDEMTRDPNEPTIIETQAPAYVLRFSYNDDSLTEYFRHCVDTFKMEHPDVGIELHLMDSVGYIQKLADEASKESTMSDVYYIDNANLGIAYLAGLATKVTLPDPTEFYGDSAINACSYQGAMVAYPLSYRTTFLAYNKAYVKNDVVLKTIDDIKAYSDMIDSEDDLLTEDSENIEGRNADGEDSENIEGRNADGEDSIDETSSQDESEKTSKDPEHEVDKIDYSKVQYIFDSNLSDIFMSYGFLGDNMNIGGPDGSDPSEFKICTSKAVSATQNLMDLINYFSIKTDSAYQDVYNRFVNGSTIFAILSTDDIPKLELLRNPPEDSTEASLEDSTGESGENASEESVMPFDYGALALPDYDAKISTAPLSITTAVAVNPYSKNIELADDFADLVSRECSNSLYNYTGRLSACKDTAYVYDELVNVYQSYEKSVPKNKLRYGEQVYPMLEIALHNIMEGAKIKTELKKIDQFMKTQLG